jgi:hypothetical protein
MDYYLKAASEAALMTALETAGAVKSITVKNEEGQVVETRWVPTEGYNLDVVGTIYRPTGNVLQRTTEGRTYEEPEMAPLSGFHANLRGPVDLAEKRESRAYQRTPEELADPNFEMPEPTVIVTPSPIAEFLVFPQSPSRVWF